MSAQIIPFFDNDSNTYSYILYCPVSLQAAVIDSVLDFDYAAGKTSTEHADQIIQTLDSLHLQLTWLLETHVHADHLSAASYLKQQRGGQIAIGQQITQVQAVFAEVFQTDANFARDGSQFDVLLSDGQRLSLGELEIQVIHTPGHTPACVSYWVEDKVFVGDTLFMPDYGSARCDFPGGSAETLFASVQRLFALPAETQMYLCHDYKAPGRTEFSYLTTVGAQIAQNIHLHQGISAPEFITMRTQRDATLKMPRLILPAVQINMRAGQLPETEANGISYLKLPLNLF